jgi:hypothetical protein
MIRRSLTGQYATLNSGSIGYGLIRVYVLPRRFTKELLEH